MDVDDYRIASKSDVLQGSTFYSVNIYTYLLTLAMFKQIV